ncbi:MAG: endonuclease/exonuclease/phosphatase family protein [Solirubrobacteraceae bacterium]|nr:endonuclease/exonuclease/phosphatase family protein [Solirubrobacteraceae bacterium]
MESSVLYVALATSLGLVLGALAKSRSAAFACACGVAVLAVVLQPRVVSDAQPSAEGRTVTIVALNLSQSRVSPAIVTSLLRTRNVDLAAFSELTPSGLEGLNRAGLRSLLPQAQAVPYANSGGLGAFSRLNSAWDEDLLPPARRWMPTLVRPRDASAFRFAAVHISPPLPKSLVDYQENNVFGELPAATYRAKGSIIAGDFNATLDNRRMRKLLKLGYRDAAEQVGAGLAPTWRAGRGLAAITIDHVLVSPEMAVRSYQRIRMAGSDHDAILVTVQLPRA